MKPWELLDQARTPGGDLLVLRRRGEELTITANGASLMSSRMHASEDALASLGCASLPKKDPAVLVGGLGMGYTLRATLDLLPRSARVVVSELVPALVEWNRGPLAALAGRPLEDARVHVEVGDVVEVLRAARGRFDAILLDVDNGPRALTQRGNGKLYAREGLELALAALRPGGTLAIWSAAEDSAFARRMRQAGYAVEVKAVRGRAAKGSPTHFIFLGRAPG